jgi:hypothetical protein
MRRRSILILIVLLSGCAATGPAYKAAEEPSGGFALVYIYRPDSLTYGARAANFFLDDRSVAEIRSNGYSYFYVKPGTYRLRQKWPVVFPERDDRELNVPPLRVSWLLRQR